MVATYVSATWALQWDAVLGRGQEHAPAVFSLEAGQL